MQSVKENCFSSSFHLLLLFHFFFKCCQLNKSSKWENPICVLGDATGQPGAEAVSAWHPKRSQPSPGELQLDDAPGNQEEHKSMQCWRGQRGVKRSHHEATGMSFQRWQPEALELSEFFPPILPCLQTSRNCLCPSLIPAKVPLNIHSIVSFYKGLYMCFVFSVFSKYIYSAHEQFFSNTR